MCVCVSVCVRALSLRRMWAHTAHAYTRRHTHSGPCPCWDATQASGLSLARKKRRLSVESIGNPRPQAQCSSLNDSARTSPRGSVTRQGLQSLDLAMKQLSLPLARKKRRLTLSAPQSRGRERWHSRQEDHCDRKRHGHCRPKATRRPTRSARLPGIDALGQGIRPLNHFQI